MAIRSFGDSLTETFFLTGRAGPKCKWRNVVPVAKRKLDMIHYAIRLEDLRSPPGNRLEALREDYAGYWSIRINDQWRVVFRWSDEGADDVEIIDYH